MDEDVIEDITVDGRKMIRRDSRLRPKRRAKTKAIVAMKINGDESTESEVELFPEVFDGPEEDGGMEIEQEGELSSSRADAAGLTGRALEPHDTVTAALCTPEPHCVAGFFGTLKTHVSPYL